MSSLAQPVRIDPTSQTMITRRTPSANVSFVARLHTTIEAVEPQWRRMQRDGVCTIYQRIEWIAGIARLVAARSGARLAIVEVMDSVSRQPLMLLPFTVRRRWACTVIEWLDPRVCDYSAPLLAADVRLTASEAALAWAAVTSVLPRGDMILVGGIPAEVFGVANPLALLPQARPSAQRAHGIALHGDAGTLVKRVCSPSFARNIGKTERRLAQQGDVRCVVAQTREEIAALFAVLVDQRLRRFQHIGRFDLLREPLVAAFYRDVALLGAAGPVRLLGLSVDGQWAATFYGLVHHGSFHGILVGMDGDERWRGTSPGLLIVVEAMRWARRHGLSYLDLTVGDLDYKERMGAQTSDLHEIAEALTWWGAAILHAGRVVAVCRTWLRGHPELFERLRALRRSIRKWRERSIQ